MTDNERVFNRIYDITYRKALIYVTAKCSSIYDIEDIMQEIYCELYSVLDRKGEGYIQSPEAFVLKLARSKVYRHYSLRERLCGISLNTDDENERELIDSLSDDIDIEDDICNMIIYDEIQRYLSDKPVAVQKIFTLYYGLELTIPEIAAELNVGESFVKNKIYRTIREIRKYYGGEMK